MSAYDCMRFIKSKALNVVQGVGEGRVYFLLNCMVFMLEPNGPAAIGLVAKAKSVFGLGVEYKGLGN